MRNNARWAVLLVVIAMFGRSAFAYAGSDQYKTLKTPLAVPAFSLQDHTGNEFGLTQLKGQWSLVFIGFTSCPDVCPLTLMQLEAVRADLGLRFTPERIPQIIFLAVDPARDKPVLGKYLAHFHPKNIGVTGEREQIDIMVKGMDAFYRFKPKPGSDFYDVVHTAAIAVIDPNAKLVSKISPPFDVHPMAEYLTQLIRQARNHE